MTSLEQYRKEIDQIDEALTQLFEKRMDIAFKIAQFKKQNNLKILNQEREKEVLQKAVDTLQNKNYQQEVTDFFNELMRISKDFQSKKMKALEEN